MFMIEGMGDFYKVTYYGVLVGYFCTPEAAGEAIEATKLMLKSYDEVEVA